MRLFLDETDRVLLSCAAIIGLILFTVFVIYGTWWFLPAGLAWGHFVARRYPFVVLYSSLPSEFPRHLFTSVPPHHRKPARDPHSGRFTKRRPF